MTADSVGGVWTYAIELCRELGRHDVEVTLVVMGARPSADQALEAARLSNVSVIGTDLKLEWMADPEEDLALAGELLLEIEAERRPDVVHLNGYAHATLPFHAPVLVAAHSCVPTWSQACRGTALPPEWDLYRERVTAAVEAAAMVVAPTSAYLRDFIAAHGTPRAARTIHNGRDPSRFQVGQKHQMALAAGRFWDEAKNISLICRAAEGLNWPVVIAGGTTSPDGNALTPPANLVCVGQLAPENLARRMSEAAVFVAPARYEPFGLGILEAAMSGCALVLGDIPTLRELWNEAAMFVLPDDEAALRSALETTLADRELSAALGAEARRRSLRYTAAAMGNGYMAAYTGLMAVSPPSRIPADIQRGATA
jgi:glycogen(starch) synthase